MEQQTNFNTSQPIEKIYKDREIWVGTLLGSTLAAGYMVAANYKAFGETDKVWKTWLVSGAATAFLFYISFFAPYIDRLPNSVFTFVWAGTVFVVVRIYQGEKINAHIRAGGQIQSWWKTLGVSLIALVVMASTFFGAWYAIETFKGANVTTKFYGTIKNDVSFDKSNVSEAEVDKIAEGLRKAGFFDDVMKKFVDAKKTGSDYEINVYCNETIKTDSEAIEYFRSLRDDLQKQFPENKIIFNLVINTPDNIVKRLE